MGLITESEGDVTVIKLVVTMSNLKAWFLNLTS